MADGVSEREKVESWRFGRFSDAVDKGGHRLLPSVADELARGEADLHRFFQLLEAGCEIAIAADIVG